MKYDPDDIARVVDEKKRRFKLTFLATIIVILLSSFAIAFYSETTLDFICALLIILSLVVIIRFLSTCPPTILFSKGISGINIKEHEYVTAGTRITRYGGISYRYIPSRHKGDVFLKLDDGDVTVITNLNKAHLDIYEIGDRLTVYPGTRYPVVEGRTVKANVCPICGNINDKGKEQCAGCGLKILKKF